MTELNPVKTAQEEVAAKVRELELQLQRAIETQKTCTVELEKWREIAVKLAVVARMSTQPAHQRHDLAVSAGTAATMPSKVRATNGAWRTWLTEHCQVPRQRAWLLAQALATVVDADANKLNCAIKRYEVDGTLVIHDDEVVVASYVGGAQ